MLKLTEYILIPEHCVVHVKKPGIKVQEIVEKKAD